MAQELGHFALSLPNERGFFLSPAHGTGISRQMHRPGGSLCLCACAVWSGLGEFGFWSNVGSLGGFSYVL